MKKLLMPLALSLLVLTSVTAQDKETKIGKNQQQVKHQKIAKALDLSKEQTEKMKTINQDFKAKSKSLKSNDNITNGELKKEMKVLHNNRQAAVKSTLNADQLKKLEEMKAKRKQHRKDVKK